MLLGLPDQRARTADSAEKRGITLISHEPSRRLRYRCDRFRVREHHHTYYDRSFRRRSDRKRATIANTNNVAAVAVAGLGTSFVTATCRRDTVRGPTPRSRFRAQVYQQCFPPRTC